MTKANRRRFFGMLAAAGTATAASSAISIKKPARTLVGYSDAHEGHRAHNILDGVDISAKCWRAERWSDGKDVAWCYDFEAMKRTKWVTHTVLHGKIDIVARTITHEDLAIPQKVSVHLDGKELAQSFVRQLSDSGALIPTK